MVDVRQSGSGSVDCIVVFPSGQVQERKLDGNMQIRTAQSEVVRFNAMAAAAG